MKVGIVEFINAYPFALAFECYAPLFAPPATINKLFRDHELDLFLGSSIESIHTPHLSSYGIAAKGKIKSVNLYTKVPPTKIQTVRLDPCSETSNALAKVLLRDHWKVKPTFVDQGGDAYVLIGDPALLNCPPPGYQTIDLATAWYEMTQLPFVFALVMHRPALETKEIEDQIAKILEWKKKEENTFLMQAAKHFGQPKDFLADYFRLCRYHLGPEEKKGLETFVHAIRS